MKIYNILILSKQFLRHCSILLATLPAIFPAQLSKIPYFDYCTSYLSEHFDPVKSNSHYCFDIFIIIINKSRWQHRLPWFFPSIHPYRSSFPAGLPKLHPVPHRAYINKCFLVVQHWHVHVEGSIEESHLWVRPYLSSVSHVMFVLLGWLLRWEVGNHTAVVSSEVLPRFLQSNSWHSCVVPIKLSLWFFIRVHMVRPNSSSDTVTAMNKFCFLLLFDPLKTILQSSTLTITLRWHPLILSDWSDFYMIDHQLIAVHAFDRRCYILSLWKQC